MDNIYDKNYRYVVSETLKDLRLNRRYTLDDISQYIRISKNTYYCYERGTRDIPTGILMELCKLYGLNYKETFKDIHNKTLALSLNEL